MPARKHRLRFLRLNLVRGESEERCEGDARGWSSPVFPRGPPRTPIPPGRGPPGPPPPGHRRSPFPKPGDGAKGFGAESQPRQCPLPTITGVNHGICTSARGLPCLYQFWTVNYCRLLLGLNTTPELEASPLSFLKALMYMSLGFGNGCICSIWIALGGKKKKKEKAQQLPNANQFIVSSPLVNISTPKRRRISGPYHRRSKGQ